MVTFTNWKLRTKLIATVVTVIVLLAGALTTYSIVTDMKNAQKEIASFRVNELAKRKQNLKSYVDIAYESILSEYENSRNVNYLEERYGKRLRSIIDTTESIIRMEMRKAASGQQSEVSARNSAALAIKQIRYDSGTGYIWINDTTSPVPRMVMHPTVPTLDGQVLDDPSYNSVGEEKQNLFVAFNEVCAQSGEGYVQYTWPKPTEDGLTEYQPKLSYVRLIEEWGWIIGTGIYINDAVTDAKQSSMSTIKDMRYDDGVGYFWINDTTEPVPVMVMHPTVPDLDGQIMDSPNYDTVGVGRKNLFVAFNEVCQADGEGFVRYMWPKPTADGLTEDQPKESYVRLFAPWNWIVGTGVYVDDINAEATVKEDQMQRDVSQSVLYYCLIAALSTAIALVLFTLILRAVTKPIDEVVVWSRNLADGDLTGRLTYVNGSEIGVQGRNLNAAAGSIGGLVDSIKVLAAKAVGTREEVSESTEETSSAFEQISANLVSVANQFEQLISTVEGSATAETQITANIGALETLVSRQIASVTQSSTAMEEMMASINNVAHTSEEKRSSTTDLMEILSDGKDKLASMTQVATTLGKSITEMMEVATIINNITSQSNMLSMNAAIEAAHAGDSGKGFSVVADEMRLLSSSTAENAKRIQATLTANVEEIERLVAESAQTSAAFGRIELGVTGLSDALTEISNAMVELSEGSHEIIGAVEEMRNISSEVQAESIDMGRGNALVSESIASVVTISEQVGNAIAEVNSGTDQISLSVHALNDRIQDMLENISEIKTGVDRFNT
jgi:methyl-accepting chemotaxis protein